MTRHIATPPAWTLAVTAMLSVQLGSALSVDLVHEVGPAGTAWLRLSFGAVVFLLIARPRLRSIARADVPALVALGVCTGLQTISFLAALERIPLGTCVAIEFLGPLTVATARSRSVRALAWPAVALAGVVLLTQPWRGSVDAVGIVFALIAAAGWAGYILFTQAVGDRFDGVSGLAITIPIAAITAAIAGIPQAAGHLTWTNLAAAAGLALLLPVLPYALEMMALRRLSSTAFGTLMALEPAFGTVLGLIVLSQRPDPAQLVGIALVVIAGGAAQRNGHREDAPTGTDDQPGPERHPVAVAEAHLF
ncbi:inner membrane transporter RhtA [Frankineae bacterium MT45]|nr:inner membrane transporter RhtA [Frankineae bacterium MT45]